MAKEVIAVDIDDVLARHFEILKKHFEERHGITLTHIDVQQGLLSRIDPGEHGQFIDSVEELIAGATFYTAPLPGAIEAIKKLKQKYKPVIITARPLSIERLTIGWLKEHFGDAFGAVDFVGAPKWGKGGNVASKERLLTEHKVSYLVDDSLNHCKKAASMGLTALLFGEYKWNEGEQLPGNIVRVKNWQEVLEYFDAKR